MCRRVELKRAVFGKVEPFVRLNAVGVEADDLEFIVAMLYSIQRPGISLGNPQVRIRDRLQPIPWGEPSVLQKP
jgi:hypothetical protein